MVRDVRKRLDKWKERFLSIGGRVVLINSVMNVISLYSLYLYRAPKKVIKELTCIQIRFLWRGVEGERCINWVSWKEVCKYKEEDELGVRVIESMNISLLVKWKWRILTENNSVHVVRLVKI